MGRPPQLERARRPPAARYGGARGPACPEGRGPHGGGADTPAPPLPSAPTHRSYLPLHSPAPPPEPPKNLFGATGDAEMMETLEEENFGVSISSPSDAEFDAVVGYLEDIIMDDDFQLIQRSFMDKHYREFEDTEENKLIYTSIFNEYICLVEKYIEEKLLDRIPGFNMAAFTVSLQQHKDEMAGDIFDMLLTFTDFLAFKEMFLDYRAEKEGRGLDLSSGLVVTSLSKSSISSSQNSLRH
ncbi:ADP-ribosylation factor-like protein 2-binding protein isoform X1 [Chrysemys picta bellii]